MRTFTKFFMSVVLALVCVAANAETKDVVFDFTTPSNWVEDVYTSTNQCSTSKGTGTNITGNELSHEGVKIEFDNKSNSLQFGVVNQYGGHLYAPSGNVMTITAPEGYKITKMVFNVASTMGWGFSDARIPERIEPLNGTGGRNSSDMTVTWNAPEGGAANQVVATMVTLGMYNKMTFTLEGEGSSSSTGWDGTVTTSLDETVLANADAVEGMTITFNGAKSVEVLEDGMVCLTETADGWPILKVWAPEYGSTSTVNGTTVTLNGWKNYSEVAADAQKIAKKAVIKKAAAADSWYIQDYGTFTVDGKDIYVDDIAVAHEAAQPNGTQENPYILEDGVTHVGPAAAAATGYGVYTYYKYVAPKTGVVEFVNYLTGSVMFTINGVNGLKDTAVAEGDVLLVGVCSEVDNSGNYFGARVRDFQLGDTPYQPIQLVEGDNNIAQMTKTAMPRYYAVVVEAGKKATVTFTPQLVYTANVLGETIESDGNGFVYSNNAETSAIINIAATGTNGVAIVANVSFADATAALESLGDLAWDVENGAALAEAPAYVTVSFPNHVGGADADVVTLENTYIFDANVAGAPLNLQGSTTFTGTLGAGVQIPYAYAAGNAYRISIGNIKVGETYINDRPGNTMLEFSVSNGQAVADFAITSVVNGEAAPGDAIEQLSYQFTVTLPVGVELNSECTTTPTLVNLLNGETVAAYASTLAYGGTEAYVRFNLGATAAPNLTGDLCLLQLSIPAGFFVAADGSKNKAWTNDAPWQWLTAERSVGDVSYTIDGARLDANQEVSVGEHAFGIAFNNLVGIEKSEKLQVNATLYKNGEFVDGFYGVEGTFAGVTLGKYTLEENATYTLEVEGLDYDWTTEPVGHWTNHVVPTETVTFHTPAPAVAEFGRPVFVNASGEAMIDGVEVTVDDLQIGGQWSVIFPEAKNIAETNVIMGTAIVQKAGEDNTWVDAAYADLKATYDALEDAFVAPNVAAAELAQLGEGQYRIVLATYGAYADEDSDSPLAYYNMNDENAAVPTSLIINVLPGEDNPGTDDPEQGDVPTKDTVLTANGTEVTDGATLSTSTFGTVLTVNAVEEMKPGYMYVVKLFNGVWKTEDGMTWFAENDTEYQATVTVDNNHQLTATFPTAIPAGEYRFVVRAIDTDTWDWLVDIEYYITLTEATSISSINVENGKVVMYNLAGQRVNNAKGIVIVNGKKVMVK